MEWVIIHSDFIALLVTFLAFILAFIEFWKMKLTAYHKLFSQLNKRYERNESIQTVIKYLRDQEPEGEHISLYQLEVFLRFFEELGLYMRTNSLKTKDVDVFFGYYLKQLYETSKGQDLLRRLGPEEQELDLLQLVKQKLNIH